MCDVLLDDAFYRNTVVRVLLVLRCRVELSGLVVRVWLHVDDRVRDLEGEQLLVHIQRSAG